MGGIAVVVAGKATSATSITVRYASSPGIRDWRCPPSRRGDSWGAPPRIQHGTPARRDDPTPRRGHRAAPRVRIRTPARRGERRSPPTGQLSLRSLLWFRQKSLLFHVSCTRKWRAVICTQASTIIHSWIDRLQAYSSWLIGDGSTRCIASHETYGHPTVACAEDCKHMWFIVSTGRFLHGYIGKSSATRKCQSLRLWFYACDCTSICHWNPQLPLQNPSKLLAPKIRAWQGLMKGKWEFMSLHKPRFLGLAALGEGAARILFESIQWMQRTMTNHKVICKIWNTCLYLNTVIEYCKR